MWPLVKTGKQAGTPAGSSVSREETSWKVWMAQVRAPEPELGPSPSSSWMCGCRDGYVDEWRRRTADAGVEACEEIGTC